MKGRVSRGRGIGLQVPKVAGVGLLLLLGGCVPEAKYRTTVLSYQKASDELGRAAEALFLHANTVEAETFIDRQTFDRQPLSRTSIDARAVLSEEGLRFRHRAILALSAYTLALAAVATDKKTDQIAAGAATAGTSLSGLTVDLESAIAKDDPGAHTADFSGVVATAATAAGELLQMTEKHHSRKELEADLRKNDPAMKALFVMIGADAERLYTRERLAAENRGVTMFARYAKAIQLAPADDAYLLELSDRLKRQRREMDLLRQADPKPAFVAWTKAHDELVTVLLGEGGPQAQRATVAQIAADVKEFATEVQPLAAKADALPQSF